MIVYTSVKQYLETATSIKDKIDRLDAIILNMMDAMAAGILNSGKEEYRYEDGQVKIAEVIRDPQALTKAIERLEWLKDQYRARLDRDCNGRVFRLVDTRNFI